MLGTFEINVTRNGKAVEGIRDEIVKQLAEQLDENNFDGFMHLWENIDEDLQKIARCFHLDLIMVDHSEEYTERKHRGYFLDDQYFWSEGEWHFQKPTFAQTADMDLKFIFEMIAGNNFKYYKMLKYPIIETSEFSREYFDHYPHLAWNEESNCIRYNESHNRYINLSSDSGIDESIWDDFKIGLLSAKEWYLKERDAHNRIKEAIWRKHEIVEI